MEKGHIAFPDFVVFELPGEIAERLGTAGQEHHPACLPVEAVDGLDPERGIAVDLRLQIGIGFDLGREDGAEIPSPLLLDAHPGGLFDHEPSLTRRQDRDP